MKNLPAVAAAAALLAQPAFAAPVTVAPTSQWIVQSSDETCRVVRQFGEKGNPVTLSFEQAAPRVPLSMVATGGPLHVPTLRTRAPVTADFTGIDLAHFVADVAAKTEGGRDLLIWRAVTFRPSGKVAGGPGGRRGRGGGGGAVPVDVQQKWRAEAYARERAVQALEIHMGRGGDDVRLETGPMAGAMGALRSCMDRQLATWGLDPAKERTIVFAPVAQTRPDTWLEFAGAPRPALRRDEQSPVTVRLLLDANGKVTGCKANSPRDGSAYEKALCDHVAQSAVIIPAKTADGTPVSSYLITTIRRSAGL